MYQKPRVERFGTLREMTRGKSDAGMDLSPGIGSDGLSDGCTAHATGDHNHAGCVTHS